MNSESFTSRYSIYRLALLAAALPAGCSTEAAISPKVGESPQEFYEANIEPIFQSKCVDCHDTRQDPPWYAALPFAGEKVMEDIDFGRQRLELSNEYPFVGEEGLSRAAYLYGLRTAILEDSMPPTIYLFTHPFASLTEREKQVTLEWIESALAVEAADPDQGDLSQRAYGVLADRCARCHTESVDGSMNGEFDFITDLEFLQDSPEYVDLDSPEDSELIVRVLDDEDPMPPSLHDKLSDRERSTLTEWIEAGAPIYQPSEES
jgi:mono/diheme cytochrome c family protein